MLIRSDARRIPLKDESVQCVVTSPPYWGLRDYGLEPSIWGGDGSCQHSWESQKYYREGGAKISSKEAFTEAGPENAKRLKETRWRENTICKGCGSWLGSLGLEPTPELYVEHLVQVFREVWRVLKGDGVCWLNLGDTYGTGTTAARTPGNRGIGNNTQRAQDIARAGGMAKQLIGIPWRVAFALQADGWWLRSDIIWHKPNPMPESCKDRPTRSHEYLFLLTKSARYYYDADAIREPHKTQGEQHKGRSGGREGYPTKRGFTERKLHPLGRNKRSVWNLSKPHLPGNKQDGQGKGYLMPEKWNNALGRNKRTVWSLSTEPVKHAHFATFPRKLVEPCILAGSREGDVVLDPFVGSGTVVRVAEQHNRIGIGCDLTYQDIAKIRTSNVQRQLGGI